jgi:hypothetical protein
MSRLPDKERVPDGDAADTMYPCQQCGRLHAHLRSIGSDLANLTDLWRYPREKIALTDAQPLTRNQSRDQRLDVCSGENDGRHVGVMLERPTCRCERVATGWQTWIWRRGGWYFRDSLMGRSRHEKPSGQSAATYDWACVIFLRTGRRTPTRCSQWPAALLLPTWTAQLSDKA